MTINENYLSLAASNPYCALHSYINFRCSLHQNSILKMSNSTLIITVLLFLSSSNHFPQCQAKPKTNSTSLVLPMTHSRLAISKSSKNTKIQESLDYVIEPLRGFRDGYLISLNLGSPPQIVQAYMDTGSDLTWVPCGNIPFDCIECDEYKTDELTSTFSPFRSSSFLRDLCTSPLCADIHSSDNPYDPCATAGCPLRSLLRGTCPRPCPSFSYNYDAGGLIVGSLTRDILRVHGSHGPGYHIFHQL